MAGVIALDQVDPATVDDLVVPEATDLAPLVDPAPFAPGTVPPPIDETGEELVELAADDRIALLNLYRRAGWAGTDHRMWLRHGIAARLTAAAATLPRIGAGVSSGIATTTDRPAASA